MNDWLQTDLPDILDDLQDVGATRLRLLVTVALACIGAVVALSAAIGYIFVGGEEATQIFIISLGLLAGPGVLGVVFAYLALVRSHLQYRFAGDVMVPFLRKVLEKFRYDSVEGIDDELWQSTDWFPDDLEHSSTTHRTHFRVEERDVKFCHLEITPPFSVFRRLAGRGPAPEVEGLFAVIEDLEGPRQIAEPDVDGFEMTADDDGLKLFVPAKFPDLRADPRTPVVDTDEVREYLRTIILLVETTEEVVG